VTPGENLKVKAGTSERFGRSSQATGYSSRDGEGIELKKRLLRKVISGVIGK